MIILADNKIPYLSALFSSKGKLICKEGHKINHDDCQNANMLLVRTVTCVNAALLSGTQIQFVGSMTVGIDHLDIAWLNSHNIGWAHAPGCNANAVAEYVLCCIAALKARGSLLMSNPLAVIIGVGECGKRVALKLKAIGFRVILIDPLRAKKETDFTSADLTCLNQADL